jgi:hypothetical protein
MAYDSNSHPAPGGALAMEPSQEASTTPSNPNERTTATATSSLNSVGSKFDPKLYRQVQSARMDESATATHKIQTVIPVKKPSKKQFVFVHPDPEYRAEGMPTIQDEATGEIYLLAANLEFPPDIENKVDFINLAAAVTTDGSLFLWYYKNSTNSWSESARIAIREASRRWVRVIPDKSSNGYILEAPMVSPTAPTWPTLSFSEILERAFGAHYIESLRHPLVRKLHGDFNV